MPVLPLVESSRVLPGPNFPLARACGDDVGGGAVFYRSAGIEPLGFAEELHAGQIAGQALEAQQRSVADEIEAALAKRSRPGRVSASARADVEESGTSVASVEGGGIDLAGRTRDYRNVFESGNTGFRDWFIRL